MPSLKKTGSGRYGAVVVDGTNFAFRYERPPFKTFKTRDGRPTGVVYGMLRGLMALRRDFLTPGGMLICCWDSKTNVRKSASARYKAHRSKEGKEHVYAQVELLQGAVPAIGLGMSAIAEGYEADDVAYTIAAATVGERASSRASWHAKRALCVSDDHDWQQLVGGRVHLWKPRKKELQTEPLDYSFEVFHSLRGDPSDGVLVPSRRINDAAALDLATKYPTVRAMYEAVVAGVPVGPPKVVEELRKHRRLILQNRDLVQLRTVEERVFAVDYPITHQDTRQENADVLFDELEFGDKLRKEWAACVESGS